MLGDANVARTVRHVADGGVAESPIGRLAFDLGNQRFRHFLDVAAKALLRGLVGPVAMQQADMGRVEDGFEPGQPVVMADGGPGQHLVVAYPVEDEVAEPRRLTGTEIYPEHAGSLANRVMVDLHAAGKVGVGFVRRFHAFAGYVELPPVKQAGERAIPVVGQFEGRLAVRALRVENPDPAVGCAKCHIVFAKQW